MRNRFGRKKQNKWASMLYTLPILLSLIILVSFVLGIQSVSRTTADKQLESLENALSRSIAQCYAVEGMYPPDLEYIKEHYGLTYDEKAYLVDYQPVGSNIAPEVVVLPLNLP